MIPYFKPHLSGKSADDRLKNIVSTIQEEQNKIIRANMLTPLIVQGVAGSGKTTIALHRIAYLVYNYEGKFRPEEFMIIAPNKFFLNYISNVLPDLGVEDVLQYTFEDFAYNIIGKRLKISDSNEKLVAIVNKDFDNINNGDVLLMIQESKFKSSMKFKDIVDNFLKAIEENYIQKKDFIIEGTLITPFSEIQELFLNTYKIYPFYKRILEIKKHLLSNLNSKVPIIIEKLKSIRKEKISNLYYLELSEKDIYAKRIEIFEQYENIIHILEKKPDKLVNEYFNTLPNIDALGFYKHFLEHFLEEFKFKYDEKLLTYLQKNTLKNIINKEISFEDLAPILYIHYKIYGIKSKMNLKHIIIDEAQDYGEFQFWTLKTILNSNSLTILGDIAQRCTFIQRY